jgi:hypothetical protein
MPASGPAARRCSGHGLPCPMLEARGAMQPPHDPRRRGAWSIAKRLDGASHTFRYDLLNFHKKRRAVPNQVLRRSCPTV